MSPAELLVGSDAEADAGKPMVIESTSQPAAQNRMARCTARASGPCSVFLLKLFTRGLTSRLIPVGLTAEILPLNFLFYSMPGRLPATLDREVALHRRVFIARRFGGPIYNPNLQIRTYHSKT